MTRCDGGGIAKGRVGKEWRKGERIIEERGKEGKEGKEGSRRESKECGKEGKDEMKGEGGEEDEEKGNRNEIETVRLTYDKNFEFL